MTEEVLFATERRLSRAEIADYLRTVAERLDAGDPVTLRSGDDSVTLDPPERPDFEVKAEREGPADAGEVSVEFELEWPEEAAEEGHFAIE